MNKLEQYRYTMTYPPAIIKQAEELITKHRQVNIVDSRRCVIKAAIISCEFTMTYLPGGHPKHVWLRQIKSHLEELL